MQCSAGKSCTAFGFHCIRRAVIFRQSAQYKAFSYAHYTTVKIKYQDFLTKFLKIARNFTQNTIYCGLVLTKTTRTEYKKLKNVQKNRRNPIF